MAELPLNRFLLGWAVLAAACGGCKATKVAECEGFLRTVEKLARCEKDPAARTQLEASARQIKAAIKVIEDTGTAATLQTLRDTCTSQEKSVVDEYRKVAPACLP